MPKVYAVQEVEGFDLSPAESYGEVVYLFPKKVQILRNSEDALRIMKEKLEKFDGDEDYLLPTGDPVLMIMAGKLCSDQANGHVRVLKWDRFRWGYYVVELWLESF